MSEQYTLAQELQELHERYRELVASNEALQEEVEWVTEYSRRVRFETAQRVARFYSGERFDLIDTPVPVLGDPICESIPLTSPESVATVRHHLDSLATSIDMTSERREDLALAVGELATNAYYHGGGRVEFYQSDAMVATRVSDVGNGMGHEEAIDCIFGEYHSTRGTLGIGWPIILRLEIDHTWLCIKGSEGQGIVCQFQQYASVRAFEAATHERRKQHLMRLLQF